ncbi:MULTISPECIES: hypothetical protein [unclassified Arthrobacter]|uniref:hypothetical protein n=1 Tax=unclassified Arthrobacter TaxID=235627 RepID=UPI001C85D838|nr:hypothetical protein [Arthrobacter sp. MAHUQ-56]MBX7442635.1 hypothetical protein [Arthrobacter sp. MAHUQ-56]
MSSSQDSYQPGPAGSLPRQLPPVPEQPAPFGPAVGAGGGWPGQGQLPGERTRARSRRKLWIILGSIGAVLLLVVLGVVILVNVVGGAASQAKGLADDFTKKVIAGDTSAAYDDYLDPALQEQLSKEAFMSGVRSLGMDGSCRPAYNDVKVATNNGVKSAEVAGQIACTGKKVDLAYRFEGKDQLLMTSIKLRPAS